MTRFHVQNTKRGTLTVADAGCNVHADVKDDDRVQTDLDAAALPKVLHVQDVSEVKAADTETS